MRTDDMIRKFKIFAWVFCGTLLFLACGPYLPENVAEAYQDLPEKIEFNFHVRPILSDRCFSCHGPDENARKANLRLDKEEVVYSKIPKKETFTIYPGQPEKSQLIKRIFSGDPDLVMPVPESNLSLSSREKAILYKWIEQGAQWQTHWAYTPPKKLTLPSTEDSLWPRNEIDLFVLKQLEAVGFSPSKEANKTTLIRRLSFDLTGLPPSLEAVNNFVNDASEAAYENLVDSLLASSSYGERWAWEWLDVARYADTNGFQGDFTRDMWPWRDWVIRAFNQNMPYDQFTIKQLAGDLLPKPSTDDIIATAFNRNHPYNTEGGTIPEETRVVNVFDRVETTATTWMGLTVNCARCHDHKYDAITQREYYQLFDYFNQTSEEGGGWGGKIKPLLNLSAEKKKAKMSGLDKIIEKLVEQVEAYEVIKFPRPIGLPASESSVAKELKGLDPRILLKPARGRGTGEFRILAAYFGERDNTYAKLLSEVFKTKRSYDQMAETATMVMVMDQIQEPRPTYILDRGVYNNPILDEIITMDVPKVLPALPGGVANSRLAFARWLVADNHPLTSRVTVNRYWQYFFGKGIVKTTEDFGVQGALPTHPELLDWLAADFQENHWDLKKLFKKIVMSATYRQTSEATQKALNLDPENNYLARAARMRLASWMIRDQALYISGLLRDSLGGKPVKPYQPEGIWSEATFGKTVYKQDAGDALYRKSLYTFWRRIVGPTFLFDNASRQLGSVKTINTNTPLHALTTLNDITYLEAARVFAERTMYYTIDDRARIHHIFKCFTSRDPGKEELDILQKRFTAIRENYYETPEEAKALISIGDYPKNSTLPQADHAALTAITSLIMNLDETLNRQ